MSNRWNHARHVYPFNEYYDEFIFVEVSPMLRSGEYIILSNGINVALLC